MQATKTSRIAMAAIASSIMLAPAANAFDFKVSGQVSRMLVSPNDAVGNELQFVDNGWSGTRFRFTGSEKADNGLTWGFKYEIQARDNSGSKADGSLLASTGDNQDNRLQDLYVSGGFGMVSFGKGDGASNGATEVDMSGTDLASTSNLQDNWGGYKITSTKSWSSVYTMFDGLSRQNRVRYDTPDFGGVSGAVSINQGNGRELAVTYKGDFSGNKLGAAIFADRAADVSATVNGNDVMGLSGSLLLANGLNFTLAWSQSETNDVTPVVKRDALFGKVGYKQGKHAVSIDAAKGKNDATDEKGDSIGLTYAYFPHPGVEVFAMLRQLDSTNVAASESVDLASVGGRIKF